jgi:hypothetical protein
MHLQDPSRKQHPSRVCDANCHAIFCKAKTHQISSRPNCLGRLELACDLFQRLVVLELRDVLDRRSSDVQQGLSREESLVAGDDHIWKCEQPREDIVAKN